MRRWSVFISSLTLVSVQNEGKAAQPEQFWGASEWSLWSKGKGRREKKQVQLACTFVGWPDLVLVSTRANYKPQ